MKKTKKCCRKSAAAFCDFLCKFAEIAENLEDRGCGSAEDLGDLAEEHLDLCEGRIDAHIGCEGLIRNSGVINRDDPAGEGARVLLIDSDKAAASDEVIAVGVVSCAGGVDYPHAVTLGLIAVDMIVAGEYTEHVALLDHCVKLTAVVVTRAGIFKELTGEVLGLGQE